MLDIVPADIRQGMSDLANNLLSFLQSHAVDPDSALIGLTPADDVINKLTDNNEMVDNCRLSREELIKRILLIIIIMLLKLSFMF